MDYEEMILRCAAMNVAEDNGNGSIAVQMVSSGGFRVTRLNSDHMTVSVTHGGTAVEALTAMMRKLKANMAHNDNGLPKEPEAGEVASALSKHDQDITTQHGALDAPSRVERALETPAPGLVNPSGRGASGDSAARYSGFTGSDGGEFIPFSTGVSGAATWTIMGVPSEDGWGVSNRRTRWSIVDEWFGVESWMHYRHDIVNPHRHAAVRYRHFMDASERVLGPDGIWSAFFDESDTYIDAAHACGWDALKAGEDV